MRSNRNRRSDCSGASSAADPRVQKLEAGAGSRGRELEVATPLAYQDSRDHSSRQ